MTIHKTNWSKFTEILSEETEPEKHDLSNPKLIENYATKLTAHIFNAFQASTDAFQIKNKPQTLLSLTETLITQIKQKQKLRRLMQKNKSIYIKTM